MKLPNLRLHETQAWVATVFGVLGILCLGVLVVIVFKNFDSELMAISFNPKGGLGRYRKMLVFGIAAVTLAVGVTAGGLGFNSLGQKRNHRQGMSWLGLGLGALVVSLAPVLLFAWLELNQPIVTGG